jgi:hypothetical protein
MEGSCEYIEYAVVGNRQRAVLQIGVGREAYNFSRASDFYLDCSCLWVWNSVSDIKGKGIWEHGSKQNNCTE